MAKKNSKKNSFNKKINTFAYNLGLVNRGLKGDTQVKSSYDRGLNYAQKKKKPLY